MLSLAEYGTHSMFPQRIGVISASGMSLKPLFFNRVGEITYGEIFSAYVYEEQGQ